ncbi:MAG: hypothetical protein ACRDQA_00325 [Nocardioidaceae bacterium]
MTLHTRALAVTGRILDTTDPITRADLRTTLCDLRTAVALQYTTVDHVHPASGHDYSPEAYRRALDSGADPSRLDDLWRAFKEAA